MRDKKLTQKKQERLNQDMFETIRNNDLPAVKKAVEAGADVNAGDFRGNISLLYVDFYKSFQY